MAAPAEGRELLADGYAGEDCVPAAARVQPRRPVLAAAAAACKRSRRAIVTSACQAEMTLPSLP